MKVSDAVSLYVRHRQANGHGGESGAQVLRHFVRTVGMERELITIQSVEVRAFLDGNGPLTRYWHRKHSALLGFYRFACGRGLVPSLPLPVTTPRLRVIFKPYVYTEAEILRLLDAVQVVQTSRKILEPSTFRVLLLLLYGTGLRPGEALRLTRGDFDKRQSLLTVRETKFYKTRLVPLGRDLLKILLNYQERFEHRANSSDEDRLLVCRDGRPLNHSSVRHAFRQLRRQARIHRDDGARYAPRLHDMRATFAVNRLTAWYRDGCDVQQLLPYLSTYLGHTSIAGTQVYLTMTPELLSQAASRFARYAAMREGCHE
jgi:integrase/recombinase XerD